jgi:hypothetical protein
MALIVGAGIFLLFHHIPIGIVVPGHIEDRELLFYGVCGKLLNCEPVQALLPERRQRSQCGQTRSAQGRKMGLQECVLSRTHPTHFQSGS